MKKCNTNQRLYGWPFLTSVLRSVSYGVQSASVDKLWIPSRYYIKVEPYPHKFWEVFKLKFPDWIVCARQYKISTFSYCTFTVLHGRGSRQLVVRHNETAWD